MSFDCYLKIEGIDGEATAKGYEKWIQVLEYRSGLRQHGGGSASGTATHSGGRADFEQFEVTKLIDKSSPKLALYCANSDTIGTVTMAVCKSSGGKQKFMEYKLSKTTIMLVAASGSSGDKAEKPTETIRFRFDKIEWGYVQFDDNGKSQGEVKAGWDAAKDCKV